jgi:isoleucyl-tRNA synthetase
MPSIILELRGTKKFRIFMLPFDIFRPQTSFTMKGALPEKEPELLHFWNQNQLYEKQRTSRKNAPLCVLHDGPPYANGDIHLGHALNKILKDFLNRTHYMQGKDYCFVPGWDCHGLPIEAKIEQQHGKGLAISDFRQKCRDFASYWIDRQKEDFKRLGILGDWDHPYQTMSHAFEAGIVRHFFKMVEKNMVYRGIKPIMWSAVEGTALAEAEIEYQDIVSDALYVRFPITKHGNIPELQNAHVIIWTTTPWSLPGNRAICYHNCAEYTLILVKDVSSDSLAHRGEKLFLATNQVSAFCKKIGITEYDILKTVEGTSLHSIVCAHPWAKAGYAFDVPLFPAEHVTTETGTGFVHTAPAHGEEDFMIGQHYRLEIPETVDEQGIFTKQAPLFTGLSIFKAFPQIQEALMKYGSLLKHERYTHSYPHSWRSKTPLIYRTTPQWFIAIDGPHQLRQKALEAIKTVKWHPQSGQTRIESMVDHRPDWCISRQRMWGVPIPLFLHIHTGELLVDSQLFQSIVQKIEKEGCDFWFTPKAFDLLKPKYNPLEWLKIDDILDVWFESGLTHQLVLKDQIPEDMILPTQWPADFYLEGSDQHRGWFQSSLFTSVALEGKAPYHNVITHGFLLDEENKKMSKSLGNTFAPAEIVQKSGADLLRLWVAHEDYRKDLRIGFVILKRVEDIYRRLRNTFRYLLGGLHGLTAQELEAPSFSVLDQYILHRLHQLNDDIQKDLQNYHFQSVLQKIHVFCSVELSSFYFDICKDILYCDDLKNPSRCGVRTTFLYLLTMLSHWLAPFLCFTTEQVWQCFQQDLLQGNGWESDIGKHLKQTFFANLESQSLWSIHLNTFPDIPKTWHNQEIESQMECLKALRRVVLGALELEREKKEITSGLQAVPTVFIDLSAIAQDLQESMKKLSEHFSESFLADFFITSGCKLKVDCQDECKNTGFSLSDHPGIEVIVQKAEDLGGQKCLRCWKVLPEVQEPELCSRCIRQEKKKSEAASTNL